MQTLPLLAFLIGTLAHAQASRQSFDVTLIKPHDFSLSARAVAPTCPDGHFATSAVPLLTVIMWAYDLKPHQMPTLRDTLPGWAKVGSRAFDVEAKTDRPITEAECHQLVQTLLADRFHFAAHWETKEGPVYDLTIAPGGHKLKRVADADQSRGLRMRVDGFDLQIPASVERGLSTPDLAARLAGFMRPQAPLEDRTGLQGLYKIDLSFSLPESPTSQNEKQKAIREASGDPELEVALRQQLGLRLTQHKGPIQLLIVDRVELPDEN